jgi:tRNA 2-thiouridine synthesizing protein A
VLGIGSRSVTFGRTDFGPPAVRSSTFWDGITGKERYLMTNNRERNSVSPPHPDAVLEMVNVAEATGAICAVLTPAIKAKLKDLEPGQVLLVRVDDPSAYLDVQAWCNLTGNTLQATSEDDGVFSFFIRKKVESERKR